jgi:hypothetical protein
MSINENSIPINNRVFFDSLTLKASTNVKKNLQNISGSSIDNKTVEVATKQILKNLKDNTNINKIDCSVIDFSNESKIPKEYKKTLKKVIETSIKNLNVSQNQQSDLEKMLLKSFLDPNVSLEALNDLRVQERLTTLVTGNNSPEFNKLSKDGKDFVTFFASAKYKSNQYPMLLRKTDGARAKSNRNIGQLLLNPTSSLNETLTAGLVGKWEQLDIRDQNLLKKIGIDRKGVENIGNTVRSVASNRLEQWLTKIEGKVGEIENNKAAEGNGKILKDLQKSLQDFYDQTKKDEAKMFRNSHSDELEKILERANNIGIEIDPNRSDNILR